MCCCVCAQRMRLAAAALAALGCVGSFEGLLPALWCWHAQSCPVVCAGGHLVTLSGLCSAATTAVRPWLKINMWPELPVLGVLSQFLRALMPAALLSRQFRRAVTLQSLTSTTRTTYCG